MPYRPNDVVKALLKLGFVRHRQVGSHLTLKDDHGHRVTIPIHNKDLKLGTLRSILKQAGLTEDRLKNLI